MRPERNSLIAVVLLVMAGCSANRHARQADNEYDATDSVEMPLRHADEYESDSGEYDYNPAPFDGENRSPSGTPVPPPVPMQEPIPAPPAIGVSRVKSVSWLRRADRKSDDHDCGDSECGDGCCTGQQSLLPPEYFTEGCVSPPRTAAVPSLRCREKTTLLEVIQGWNLRAKTRRPERVRPSRNCGEPTACDPGLITPEGCNSSPKRQRTAPVVKRYAGETPDDLIDLPSKPETPASGQTPQNIPDVPKIEPIPVLPMAEPAPAIQDSAPSPVVPPQASPDAVKQIVRPPLWPRLGSAAATSIKAPVSNPANSHDSSLPAIQPGRRI